jgi:hypothetical protein
VAAELGGTEFDNFERWFDGQNDLSLAKMPSGAK